MDVEVKVLGMEEIVKKLKKLEPKLRNSILSGAIRAGAKLVADEARLNVPVESAHLKKSILVRKRRSKDKTILHFTVAPVTKIMHQFQDANGEKHYNYGNIIEMGNSTHVAQPYMRPAFENKGEESINETRKYMEKRFSKMVGEL